MKFEYWLSNIYIDNTKKINLKRSGIDAKTLFYMKNDELEKLQILTGNNVKCIYVECGYFKETMIEIEKEDLYED